MHIIKYVFYFLFLILVNTPKNPLQADINVINYSAKSFNNKDLYQLNPNKLSATNPYLHNHNNFNYLLTSTGIGVTFMAAGIGILYSLPTSVTNWDSDNSSDIFSKWWNNVRSGPVWDKDDFYLNWITHPYWGAIYYMQGRNAGYNKAQSFLLSAFISTFFWEYGIESIAEIPSKQDLIITPIVGSIIGELFYMGSQNIKSNNNKLLGSKILGYTFLVAMDPLFLIIEHTALHKYTIEDNPLEEQSSILTSHWSLDTDSIKLNIKIHI